MNETKLWIEQEGEGPLLATSVHAGHDIRNELLPLIALDEATRLREEDPYTDAWVHVVPSWLIPKRSRFEVDLNREREEAVYLSPEIAWGLHIWKHPPTQKAIHRSLEEYDEFYEELGEIIGDLVKHYGHLVIFDLHAYNHRREGPDFPPADPETNPEVNIGTGSVNREIYGALVERFVNDLSHANFLGRSLDVRENVKFEGRQVAHWIHEKFPNSTCVLAIEFKKIFMDEWTGAGFVKEIEAIRDALASTLPGLLEELKSIPIK